MSGNGENVRDRAIEVLIAHQRYGSGSCLCGPLRLGRLFSAHQADALIEAGLLIPDVTP